MCDPRFGFDVMDNALAQQLGIELWSEVGAHLSIHNA